MTIGPELACPKCRRPLESRDWHDAGSGYCRNCFVDFEFIGLPALNVRRAEVVPKAVLVAEHATCFHHPENQAEAVCEGCGRFLCSVCAIPFAGRLLCPDCIGAATKTDSNSVGSRVLYDGIALGIAVIPLIPPLTAVTFITSPFALAAVIFSWKKPRSLVSPRRTRLVIAGVIALAEIVGWVIIFISIWLKKKR